MGFRDRVTGIGKTGSDLASEMMCDSLMRYEGLRAEHCDVDSIESLGAYWFVLHTHFAYHGCATISSLPLKEETGRFDGSCPPRGESIR